MKHSCPRVWSPLFLLLLLIICSCTEKTVPERPVFGTGDLSAVLINASLPPLYADLPNGSGQLDTKAVPVMVPLESALDRKRQKKTVFKEESFIQIPFTAEYSGQMAYFGRKPEGDPEKAAVLKRFLVVSKDEMFVATMVTESRYWASHPSFDYLDKPDYTGAVVFSTVSGKMIKVQAYESGRILQAGFVTGPEADGIDGAVSYILVYSGLDVTKSGSASTGSKELSPLTGSYAITVNPEKEGSPWYWDPDGNTDAPIEKSYTVDLSCDIPDEIQMTGNGTYTAGSTVVIDYRPKHSVSLFALDHWTGDFAWTKSARFSQEVTRDLESTAYFATRKPCTSNVKHITNPLLSMRIAASNVSMALGDADDGLYVNYYGGTFGETRVDRDGKPKRHDGLDLYAEVGTPVYAAYAGVITKAESKYGDVPVSNSYGNELRITTVEKNRTVVVQYAHLQAGVPFATNPRTGYPFKVNDKVYQGDLIGYTGRTGNAVDSPNPHLHFGILAGGKWVDPRPYINGTYPSGRRAIDESKGMITGTRCD